MNRKGFYKILLLIIGALVVFGIGVSVGIYFDSHNLQKGTLEPRAASTTSVVASPTSTGTILPPPLYPDEIHWSDAITLISQCQATMLISKRFHFSGGDYITLKSGQSKKIVESPGFLAMRSAAQAASSTCGMITVNAMIE